MLLKPNLVEYSPAAPINTHPMLIASVIDALHQTGCSLCRSSPKAPDTFGTRTYYSRESGLRAQLESSNAPTSSILTSILSLVSFPELD